LISDGVRHGLNSLVTAVVGVCRAFLIAGFAVRGWSDAFFWRSDFVGPAFERDRFAGFFETCLRGCGMGAGSRPLPEVEQASTHGGGIRPWITHRRHDARGRRSGRPVFPHFLWRVRLSSRSRLLAPWRCHRSCSQSHDRRPPGGCSWPWCRPSGRRNRRATSGL